MIPRAYKANRTRTRQSKETARTECTTKRSPTHRLRYVHTYTP